MERATQLRASERARRRPPCWKCHDVYERDDRSTQITGHYNFRGRNRAGETRDIDRRATETTLQVVGHGVFMLSQVKGKVVREHPSFDFSDKFLFIIYCFMCIRKRDGRQKKRSNSSATDVRSSAETSRASKRPLRHPQLQSKD